MYKSGPILHQARRAVLAAFVLGGFASLLQLALPFYALHVVESALSQASLETLLLLAVIVAGAGAALACLASARDRILLRAGLWLDHTLGAHLLHRASRAGAEPEELSRSADALGRLAQALTQRMLLPAMDAVWLPVFLAALALLHPALAAVTGAFAALLLLAALLQARTAGRLSRQAGLATRETASWWASAVGGRVPGPSTAAIEQWERLDRARIAAVYALERRRGGLRDLARLAAVGAQIAMIGAGAWLVMREELSLSGFVAAMLMGAIALRPLAGLLATLPAMRDAMAAYRLLSAREPVRGPEAGADPASAAVGRPAAPPRLNLRAPLAAGVATVLLLAAAAAGAALARRGDLAGLAGGAIFETRLAALQYPKGRAGVRLLVHEGAEVRAGDVIVRYDTASLDRHIASLKAQAETARRQLEQVRREAASLAGTAETQAADKTRLASLELRIGELQSEGEFLHSRIAAAERELAGSEVRAPVSGRVVGLAVDDAGPAAGAGTIRLQIATADGPLLERLLQPINARFYRAPRTR